MKRLAAALTIATIATILPAAVQAHEPGQPMPAATYATLNAPAIEYAPEAASNCQYTIRASATSAVGICYNYTGSGDYRYQVAALVWDGCAQRFWMYGSVGHVYVRGKTTSGKWSYVYSPPGKWRITYAKVIVWKP